ncbi:hypothetical protein JCM19046_4581 [Bacillus sp. JCM 19046]|nr:hypothetical protein JCM19046_4581 [Bacillus sp. JCM 19046]
MNERLPEYYDPIVRALAADIYQAFPALQQRYGEKGWKHTIEDNEHHFRHLEAAYAIRDQQVFVDYALVKWHSDKTRDDNLSCHR